ncbi:hypothetical protein MRX96_054791 [Rhipicephalus microplus]
MSRTPKRRKLYLEPSFDGKELPRSTRYRASRLATDTSQVENVMSDGNAAADEPADNSPVRVWANDEVDECEESGPSDDEEALAENAKEDDRETDGSFDSDLSAEDIVTLVMDFAVNFGLAWTQKWVAQNVVEVDRQAAPCLWIDWNERQFFCNLANRFP